MASLLSWKSAVATGHVQTSLSETRWSRAQSVLWAPLRAQSHGTWCCRGGHGHLADPQLDTNARESPAKLRSGWGTCPADP